MDRADLRISVSRGDAETVVSVNGDLDVSTATRLADTVNEELREPPSRIVLDLAGLTFCDSLGLGTLVVLSRTALCGIPHDAAARDGFRPYGAAGDLLDTKEHDQTRGQEGHGV